MHLRLEQAVNAPADRAWHALGTRFADIDEWSTVVKTSRPLLDEEVPPNVVVAPGAPVPGRVTVTKAKLVEVLTAYSDQERSLTFEGVGLPRAVRTARDTQSVEATGPTSSTVVFAIDVDLAGPLSAFEPIVRRRMKKTFGGVLADLKRHVEAPV